MRRIDSVLTHSLIVHQFLILYYMLSSEQSDQNGKSCAEDNRHSGSVVERPLCDREVAGSIPGRVIPKTLKMVLAALSLGAQH